MNTSLKHLSQGQRGKVERAVRIIIRAVQPEKIILFGLYSGTANGEALSGITVSLPPVLGAFDLLVVTRAEDRRSDYELQDLIENRCREEVAITALVHDIGYVNRRLSEGQPFFSMVAEEGVLLYDAHRTPLAEAGLPDWEQVRWIARRDFERWGRQARAFFAARNSTAGERMEIGRLPAAPGHGARLPGDPAGFHRL